jgi:cytochrome P450
MKCPKCRTILLQRRCDPGIVVDTCVPCGGAWLDEGEAVYFTSSPDAFRLALQRGLADACPTGIDCPRCGGDLEATPLGGGRRVERCSRCAGLWIDAGEMGPDTVLIPGERGSAAPTPEAASPPREADAPRPTPMVERGILGSAIDFARDPVRTILEAASLGDVVRLRMAHSTMFVVNSPEGVKHVLQDNAHNYSRERNQASRMLRPLLGVGVLTSDGPVWRARRKAAQRAFGNDRLAAMDADMKDEALAALGRLRRAPTGEPLDVYGVALRVAIATTLRSMFGYRSTEEEREALYHAILEGQHAAWSNLVFPLAVPRWLPAPLRVRQGRRVLGVVDRLARRVIEGRRALRDRRRDYLDGILDTCATDGDIRDEVVTMITAAPENMAYTLSIALYLLAGHPPIEAEIREEIQRVLGRRQPVAADLGSMPVTAAVLKETLRLHPGAYIFDRWAVHEDRICGHVIPAGSFVLLSPHAMHRRADLWPDPERFDPTRFATPAPDRPRYAYFPFGGGPHRCLGEHFALMHLQLLLPLALQQARFRRVSGRPVVHQAKITVRPADGVWMHIEPLAEGSVEAR